MKAQEIVGKELTRIHKRHAMLVDTKEFIFQLEQVRALMTYRAQKVCKSIIPEQIKLSSVDYHDKIVYFDNFYHFLLDDNDELYECLLNNNNSTSNGSDLCLTVQFDWEICGHKFKCKLFFEAPHDPETIELFETMGWIHENTYKSFACGV